MSYSPIRFVVKSAAPHRWRFLGFFITSGLGIVCFTGSPFVVGQLINHLVGARAVDATIWTLVVVFIIIRLADEWLWRIGEWIISTFLPQMRETVRSQLLTQTLQKHHSYFVNANSGQISYWINSAADTVRNMTENIVWTIWPQLCAAFFAMVFLAIASWPLAIIFAGWMAGLIVVLIYRSRRLAVMVESVSDAVSATSGRVTDTIANMLAVRVFAAGRQEVASLQPAQRTIVRRWRRSWNYALVTNAFKGNSAAVMSGIAIVAAILLYARGNIELGSIAMVLSYITSASESIWLLSGQIDVYIRDHGALKNALTNLQQAPAERDSGIEIAAKKIDVRFDNIAFAYPDQPEQLVLHDLTFHIAAGERVGIVGHSGAGKSTLTGLLLGLYEPTAGTLTLGGDDVRDISLASLRTNVAYVPQDSQLFNRTIAENIRYGTVTDDDDAAIQNAARKAQADEFIQKLPHAYNTLVGERGVKLSGGQRQRIAIARAMLSQAPLIILDEATSALDSVSEQHIQKAFAEVMKGRTALVIAHRLSTLQHLDRIVVIDAGRVVESGTHAELLAKKAVYADLWRRQKDGFIGE